jgi:phosphoribosylamine---glycine ligase
MDILVVGGGGREHAIVWKLSKSPLAGKIYCAPGNGGISDIAECVPINAMDIGGMTEFAKNNRIGLVVVAPDDPLGAGMVDAMEALGIRAFGPSKDAAAIESSKVFSKNLMKKYGIPTAEYEVFEKNKDALKYLKNQEYPLVIKAEGLALGKGVKIVNNFAEAREAVTDIMERKIFGNAGNRIVIEEFLMGREVTVLAFTDGNTIVPMVSSQDHKRAYDNDEGPNTGGMGAFSPSRIYTPETERFCIERIFKPTVKAMNNEKRKFKGVLYFGLIITDDGPKVIEYNSRFGDPEAQVVLPRLETDFVEIMEAVIDERLDTVDIKWSDRSCACIIIASGGYPVKYEKGYEIKGLDTVRNEEDVFVFHSGTRKEDNRYYTAGGRVLGVTALENGLDAALGKAYEIVRKIHFKDMHYRKDIGRQ